MHSRSSDTAGTRGDHCTIESTLQAPSPHSEVAALCLTARPVLLTRLLRTVAVQGQQRGDRQSKRRYCLEGKGWYSATPACHRLLDRRAC